MCTYICINKLNFTFVGRLTPKYNNKKVCEYLTNSLHMDTSVYNYNKSSSMFKDWKIFHTNYSSDILKGFSRIQRATCDFPNHWLVVYFRECAYAHMLKDDHHQMTLTPSVPGPTTLFYRLPSMRGSIARPWIGAVSITGRCSARDSFHQISEVKV